jgi:uncharacterized protein YycO
MGRIAGASMRALYLVPLALSACSAGSMVIKKPVDRDRNRAVDRMWAGEIARVARSGDWILTRSYSFNGDLIAGLSAGESISHASIYDAERGTVIEAITPVVREIPLEQLLARNHYAIVVRPSFLSAAEQRVALARARAQVGRPFDIGGIFGLGAADKFYCSELVVWAADTDGHGIDTGALVTPSSLMNYGAVIYFSGKRTDPQVQASAGERQAARVAAGAPR